MALRLIHPHITFLDANGAPLAGGKLEFFDPGTTNQKNTFSDEGLTSANANPIVLNSAGRVGGDVWGSGDFKLVVSNSSDVQQGSFDPVLGASLSGVLGAANNIAFTGNNTHSGTETFTGNVEIDDADLYVSYTDPTVTTEGAVLRLGNSKALYYRVDGVDENTTKQYFKYTIADVLHVAGALEVVAFTDSPFPAGISKGFYLMRQLSDGAGPIVGETRIESHGFLALCEPVVSGSDVIFGANISDNGTSPTSNTVHFYIRLYFDTESNFTFGGLGGGDNHTGAFVSNSVAVGRDIDPIADNTYDLGNGSNRFDDVFATNGTIQTSDASQKSGISLPADALLEAVAATPIELWQWNESIAAKGDAARWHTGMVMQKFVKECEDRGVDPAEYGAFCKDFLADGTEILSTRATQLLFLQAAAFRREMSSMNARIIELEAS